MLENPKVVFMAVLMGGALIGGGAAYVGMEYTGMSGEAAGEKAASTLERQSGAEFEVVNVQEESGLYEVQLSSNNQLQTVHVTKDGKFLSGQMTDLDQLSETLELQSTVQTCLQENDAVMYGNISQRATQAQIQVLGGAQQVSDYYKDVNNPGNLQEATNRGVTSVPTIYLSQDEQLTNVNNLSQISSFADCQ